MTYHQNKLHENNIFLDDIKINQIIRNVRNMNYPNDDAFIKTITNITITFYEKVSDATNVPFCPIHMKFVNPTIIDKNKLFY